MHNPFPLYSTQLLDALIKAGHKYFVRQTYRRGTEDFDEAQKGAFLISHYSDKRKAEIHFEALNNNSNRFLYDISNTEHLEKLKMAAAQPEGYKIYAPLLLQGWTPPGFIAGKVRKYIDYKLKWDSGREDIIKTNLFIQFGELFIALKFRSHEVKIPLSDIERL